MINLKSMFNISFSKKAWHTVRNKINSRSVHEFQSTSEDDIIENILGPFVTIGINLTDTKNVLTETALERLVDSINKFEGNNEIHAAVLHGFGGNFCSGVVATAAAAALSQNLINTLHTLKKPIIASLDGYTLDFGLHIAIMCDIRIMDESALAGFRDKAQKLEISPFLYERLIWTVGLAKAFELLCTRQTISATECLSIGLVNKTAQIGCALGQSILLAQSIAFNSSLESIIEHKSKMLSFLKPKV